jgi:hypothetical protein|tara:strand:- start:475 stop:1329 length:855 start_codon:yes stop_codon:yes gene_type:complete
MGLFKKLKKAFKKITGGIKKAVKGVLKGVKKVVKKISKSKLFKAIVIAAAIYVTGGAAISAFTGGTATGFAGSWMAGATNLAAGTGLTATGAAAGTWTAAAQTAAGVLATPFAAVGTALGSGAAAVTDFTGLTTAAGRTGASAITSVAPTGGAIGKEAVLLETQAAANLASAPVATGPIAKIAEAGSTFAKNYPRTTAFLGTVGTGVATSVATGYAMQQIAGDPDLTGSMSGLRTEGSSDFDPLRVYAAERGIADSDISKYFTFSNTPEGGNMPLFQQETLQVS